MLKRIQRFFVDECGPTAVEYAVMLALIAASLGSAAAVLGARSGLIFQATADSLEVQKSQGGKAGGQGQGKGGGKGGKAGGGPGGGKGGKAGGGRGGRGGGKGGGKGGGGRGGRGGRGGGRR